MAPVALLEFAGVQLTAFMMPAVWAFESVPPAQLVECLEVLLLGPIGGDEFCQIEVFLILCLICHDLIFVNLNNNIYITYYINNET